MNLNKAVVCYKGSHIRCENCGKGKVEMVLVKRIEIYCRLGEIMNIIDLMEFY